MVDITLTLEEKILLHLADFKGYRDKAEVVPEVTQEGIAGASGVRRSHVSAVLKKLKEKGMVEEKRQRIKGRERRQKTYFLTSSGADQAHRMRGTFLNKKITLRLEDGSGKEVKIKDVNRHLKRSFTLLDILNNLEGGVLEIKKPIKKPAPEGEDGEECIDYSGKIPEPKHFFGREKELEKLRDFLESEQRILALKGIAGIGKTTLLAKFSEGIGKDKLFWFRLHEWSSLRNLLSSISTFLSAKGRKDLAKYLSGNNIPDINESVNIIEDALDRDCVLIFDDFHKAQQQVVHFLKALKNSIITSGKGKMIVSGRRIVSFYKRNEVTLAKMVKEMQLKGLDRKSSMKFFKKLDKEAFGRIYSKTKGHPLSLELIETSGDYTKLKDVKRYVYEEISKKLDSDEKLLLEVASVYRYPVPAEAYLIGDSGRETLEGLLDASLVQVSEDIYDLHDLVREYFYSHLSPRKRSDYHRFAVLFYEDREDPLSEIEAVYHLVMAEEYIEAAQRLAEKGDSLIKGYQDEVCQLLDLFDDRKILKRIGTRYSFKLRILRGKILLDLGAYNEAEAIFKRCLEQGEGLEEEHICAQANYELGVLSYIRGKFDAARGFYDECLDSAKRCNDLDRMAKTYNTLGLVRWQEKDLDSAVEFFNKDLKLSEQLRDRGGVARAYNNLGIIAWEKKEYDNALELYNKALEISEELGDKKTVAILYDNIGEVYRLKKDRKKAREHYEKSLEMSEELGFKWQIAEVYRNLAQMERGKKRKEYLERSLSIFKGLGAEKEVEAVERVMGGK